MGFVCDGIGNNTVIRGLNLKISNVFKYTIAYYSPIMLKNC
jgi:hypothetical protein